MVFFSCLAWFGSGLAGGTGWFDLVCPWSVWFSVASWSGFVWGGLFLSYLSWSSLLFISGLVLSGLTPSVLCDAVWSGVVVWNGLFVACPVLSPGFGFDRGWIHFGLGGFGSVRIGLVNFSLGIHTGA